MTVFIYLSIIFGILLIAAVCISINLLKRLNKLSEADENGRGQIKEESNLIKLTFELRGGIGIRCIEGIGGAHFHKIIPKRQGYRFCGWFYDEAGTNSVAFDTQLPMQDEVWYAMWLSL